jgi:hypothetical protein
VVKASVGLVLLGCCLPLVTREARAQEPPALAATDVVRLKNGGLLRGTISELVPGESVEIVTVTGERRRFDMKEVSYAGPASEMPAAKSADPERRTKPDRDEDDEDEDDEDDEDDDDDDDDAKSVVTVHAKEAKLRLTTDPKGYTFHRRSSSAFAVASTGVAIVGQGFQDMCASPCDVSMPAGRHVLAVSKPDGFPVAASPVTVPAGSSSVHATYTDNTATRTAGVVVAALSMTAGALVMMVPIMSSGPGSDIDTTPIWAGAGIMTGGGLLGILIAFTPDEVEISLRRRGGAR